MKNLILCYLVCFLFSTLIGKEAHSTSFIAPRQEFRSEENNKQIIQGFYKAMINKDLKTIYALLSENYTMKSLNHQSIEPPGQYDAFSKNLDVRIKALHHSFPDFKVEIIEIVSEGKKALAMTQLTGIQKGSFLGLEPTGKRTIIHMMSLFLIESGKITDIQEMWNELDVMKQLGYILLR